MWKVPTSMYVACMLMHYIFSHQKQWHESELYFVYPVHIWGTFFFGSVGLKQRYHANPFVFDDTYLIPLY